MTFNNLTEEMIEEWDWLNAVPSGKAVNRKTAHQKGIAHEGVHLWIARNFTGKSGEKHIDVLFQKRAKNKDTFPDTLDITVGGHVPYGRLTGKIQKESEEEIGISPKDNELHDLGIYRYEERIDNLFHREFQRVYILIDNRPLNDYIFADGEVTGIFAVNLYDLEKILKNDFSFTITGYNGISTIEKKVSRADFHPLLFSETMKIYMKVVLQAVKEIIYNGFVLTKMPAP